MLVLSLLATAQLMLVLDVTVVNVALPRIGSDLALGRDSVPWVMTAYTLAFGGLMLLGGRLADLVGPRRMLPIGLTVFTAASLVCSLSGDAPMLIAGRIAQGIGAALLSPAALALVTASTAGEARARALAVWGALSGGGTALGVALGGLLTSALGWQWIFVINVPIGILVLVAIPLLTPASQRTATAGRFDIPGAVLVTAATGAVIYGLVNAGGHGWTARSTLVPLAGGIVGWALFALVERATQAPLLKVGLLRQGPVAAGAFLMVVATGLMVGGFFVGSFTLQRAHGYSAIEVGLAFLPVAVAVIAGAHLAGRLLARVPARAVAVVGLALAAAGEGLVAVFTAPASVIAGLAVAALGIGATFVTAFTAALATADPDTAGLRSALVSTFHELGGAVGVAVLSTMVGTALTASRPSAGDFTPAFTAGAIAAAVAAIVAAALVPSTVRTPGRGHAHH
ncbi:MFS transporter [Rugosimonospora africana]|nr:MFS transporter [Rugosimonospora africana]